MEAGIQELRKAEEQATLKVEKARTSWIIFHDYNKNKKTNSPNKQTNIFSFH
jgi:hypothetical protein